jgi:predicted DNA-binding protein with PD1-like motif
MGKVLPITLPPGKDLFESLKTACKENGIRYAAILSTVGSLSQLTIEGVVASKDSKTGTAFGPPKVVPGPLQLMGLEGIIYESEKGEMDTHVHGVFADADGVIYAGHLIEGGSPIATRLVTVLGEITDVKVVEKLDKQSGHLVVSAEPV